MDVIGKHCGSRNRLDIDVSPDEVIYFRTGAFLRHPNSRLKIPQKGTLPISRWSQQLFFMFRVAGEPFVATTPYSDAYLAEVRIRRGEKLICKLDHVLGFSESVTLNSKWKIDTTSLLLKQFRYTYLSGPGRVFVFGLGEIGIDSISGSNADYDSGSVIGWTSALAVGASSRSSALSALLAKEDIVLHRFSGDGVVLTQASTIRKLPRRFHGDSKDRGFVDYLNAFLGLRI